MLRRNHRKASAEVVYNAHIVGTARIIYDEKAMELQGILTDKDDRCFSLRGYIVPDEKKLSTTMSANFDVLDGEANHNFKINDVVMKIDADPNTAHRRITLEHPSLTFVTEKWHRGYRAAVEISEHLNPQMVGHGCDLFVGTMTIHIISLHYFVPLKRRLSLVDNNIIESSNDFLA